MLHEFYFVSLRTVVILICHLIWASRIDTVFGEELESVEPTQAPPFDPERNNFTLAGLTKKEWEGPYYAEAFLGSTIFLPCTARPEKMDRLYRMRKLAATEKYYWSILWVHKTWDTVIDPWMGDGRRGYDRMQLIPYWKPDLTLSLDNARLSIVDANPSDNGVYACVVAMYPPEKGLSPVILSQSELVSVHFLRIKSGQVLPSECTQEEFQDAMHCLTGFEDWTEYVYYPTGINKGDVIFQAPCKADIFLTALALGGVDPTFWSIGWRFVPQNAIDDTRTVEMDAKLEMNFRAPVHVCVPEYASATCIQPSTQDRSEPVIGRRDLELARKHASKLWKARWLVLSGTVPQSSGRWQCWIQGLGMTSHPKTKSFPVRWFIDEIPVKIIPEAGLYTWWSAVDFWRFLGLISSPMVFILVGLIMVVGRLAAYMHPEKIPPKKHIKLLLDRTEDLTSLTTKSGNEMEEVDPNEYMHTFLRKQGIEAYELLPTKI
ncbi:hypothetical protein FBUS_10382 [Fasciolopsis buskii]|uniref:Ig-like domain-containing protein n=1 Tax=Fasciolopsis buskii TaxID=27845 RepID=A0A8E0VEW0_9TREM|nr:hypothetical protein FBUS_10382 [Fasciolopsis buski]